MATDKKKEEINMEHLKGKRNIVHTKIEEITNKLNTLVIKEMLEDDELSDLLTLESMLKKKMEELDKITENIQDNLPIAEIKEDIEYMDDLQQKSFKIQNKVQKKKEYLKTEENKVKNIKLPTIQITPFDGDITKYRSFIQQYNNLIDSNGQLSNIEKMNYLVSLLKNKALKVVEGLSITNENYLTAKTILDKNFNDTEKICNQHINKIIFMRKLTDINNIHELKDLTQQIIIHLRSLENLGVTAEEISKITLPIVKSKFPMELQLIFERQDMKEKNINTFIEAMNKELTYY